MNYERPVKIPETIDINTLNDRLKLLEYESTGLSPEQCEYLHELCELYDKLGITPGILNGLLELYETIQTHNKSVKQVYLDDELNLHIIWVSMKMSFERIISMNQ